MFWRRAPVDHEAKSLAELEAFFQLATATSANIAVSPTRALEAVPVRAAVQLRCETLSSLPLRLFRRLEDGGKDKAVEHPLYRLIHQRPNAWTSASQFVADLERDTLLHGHGIALANRVDGKVKELIKLDPAKVTLEADQYGEPRYVVSLHEGGTRTYSWRDILHVQSFDGLSAVKQAREAIGLYVAMERHAGRIFANGGRPSGILKAKGRLGKDVLDRLKASWSANHSGESSGGTAILEDGLDFQPLTFSSVDMEFAALRAFQLVEIARAFAVPPVLIADYSRATWSNFDPAAQSFLSFCLVPRIKIWTGAISRLLSADEQAAYSPEFDTNALVQGDIEKRFKAYASAIASRILNPNEVRELENRGPYPAGGEFANPNVTPGSMAA